MKKQICLMLCLLMVCLSACAPAAVDDTTVTTAATTETTQQGIKNIVLIIGDGMGNAQLEAGQLVEAKTFGFTAWEKALVNTNSLNSDGEPAQLTDSAASATALATGMLTTNGRIGRDPDGNDLKTILDYAKAYGKTTGVVTTDALSGATPASFSGHSHSRENTQEILVSQLYSNIDLLCGKYTAEAMENREQILGCDYTLCTSQSAIKDTMDAEKMYWLLNIGDYNASDKLAKVTTYALDYLAQDPDGFVLMIEQANIDKYGHSNNFEGIPKCVNVLNDTVESVLAWVGDREDTAIIVTADHETGGLQLSREPEYGLSAQCDDGSTLYYSFSTTGHTQSEVSVFAYGFDPEFARYEIEGTPGVIKNRSIFDIMLELLEDPLQED